MYHVGQKWDVFCGTKVGCVLWDKSRMCSVNKGGICSVR
jgi:hypothetical protein